jgi:hypothetical protein
VLKFASGENRSEIRTLPFTNTANRLWGGALAATAPDFLKSFECIAPLIGIIVHLAPLRRNCYESAA